LTRKATCLDMLILTLVALLAFQIMTSLAIPRDTLRTIDARSIECLSLISLQPPKIDREPPELFIESPSPGEVVKSSNVAVVWRGVDDISGISRYEVALDYGLWINTGLNNTHFFYDLRDGGHTISIRAFDNVGNMAQTSFDFTVATGSFQLPDYAYGAVFVGVIIIAAGITLFVVGQRGLPRRRVTSRRLVR